MRSILTASIIFGFLLKNIESQLWVDNSEDGLKLLVYNQVWLEESDGKTDITYTKVIIISIIGYFFLTNLILGWRNFEPEQRNFD